MAESWGNIGHGVDQVPSGAPQNTGGGIDYAKMIQSIVTPDQKLFQAASTPIAGPHAQQVPTSLQREVEPHQNVPMDQRHVVGAGNAKARGIGNAITGVVNGLGAVVTAEAKVKHDQIKDAATRVINAQSGRDEAQQAHDSALALLKNAAPGSQEAVMYEQQVKTAQVQIDKNKKIMDDTFADSKTRNALVKGFNISHVDPEQNKTPEHEAVIAAMKEVQAAKDKQSKQAAMQKFNQAQGVEASARYTQAQPQGFASNVQAQQQVAMQQATQKLQLQGQKDLMAFQASTYRSDRTVDAARIREIGAGILQTQRLAYQQMQQDVKFKQAEHLLGERFNNSVKLVYIHGIEARKVANEIYTDREADPLTMYTKNRKASDEYQKTMITAGNSLVTLQNARMSQYIDSKGAKIKESEVDQQAVRNIDAQIELVKGALENAKANSKNFSDQAQRIQQTFGLNERTDLNGGNSGASTDEQSDSSGETDYTDPLQYLNSTSSDE